MEYDDPGYMISLFVTKESEDCFKVEVYNTQLSPFTKYITIEEFKIKGVDSLQLFNEIVKYRDSLLEMGNFEFYINADDDNKVYIMHHDHFLKDSLYIFFNNLLRPNHTIFEMPTGEYHFLMCNQIRNTQIPLDRHRTKEKIKKYEKRDDSKSRQKLEKLKKILQESKYSCKDWFRFLIDTICKSEITSSEENKVDLSDLNRIIENIYDYETSDSFVHACDYFNESTVDTDLNNSQLTIKTESFTKIKETMNNKESLLIKVKGQAITADQYKKVNRFIRKFTSSLVIERLFNKIGKESKWNQLTEDFYHDKIDAIIADGLQAAIIQKLKCNSGELSTAAKKTLKATGILDKIRFRNVTISTSYWDIKKYTKLYKERIGEDTTEESDSSDYSDDDEGLKRLSNEFYKKHEKVLNSYDLHRTKSKHYIRCIDPTYRGNFEEFLTQVCFPYSKWLVRLADSNSENTVAQYISNTTKEDKDLILSTLRKINIVKYIEYQLQNNQSTNYSSCKS